nr:MAG TPA: hypothetical protein [Caudoviricetes sp.]
MNFCPCKNCLFLSVILFMVFNCTRNLYFYINIKGFCCSFPNKNVIVVIFEYIDIKLTIITNSRYTLNNSTIKRYFFADFANIIAIITITMLFIDFFV